jgi:PAS domain S-box-containing protein
MRADQKHTRSLRRKAEKSLSEAPEKLALMSGMAPKDLIHELSVLKIELEMQGEELRSAQEQLEESRTERKRAEMERDRLESQLRQAHERQMADEVLRRSEEQFRALAEHSPDVIDRFDREMRHVYVNPVGLRLRGREARHIIGKTIRETGVPEPYCTLREEKLQQVFATGEVGEIEGLFPTVDGMKFYQSSLAPEYDSQGNITFVLVVSRDVTERAKAEEALRESEQHYRSLFDNMLNGFAYCRMLFDENGPKDFTFLEVNAAFVALTGLQNVIGRNMSEIIPGIRESDPKLFETYGRVALTGMPERFETYVRALGMWFSIAAYSPRRGYFVTVFDVITERKRTEEALRRSHEELERRVLERTEALRRQADLLELAYNAIIVRDLSGRVTFWNARAEEFYGFTRIEALGQVAHALLQTRFPASFEEHMTVLTAEGRWEGELTHTRKDGRQLVVFSRQALQRDEAGRPVAIMEINLDITERKRTEDALRRQAALVEARPDAHPHPQRSGSE